MAAWIKMPLGMELGLSPGDFVSDGDLALPSARRGRSPQIFGPCLLWPNGWMDQGATWYGDGLGPGRIVLDGDPTLPSQKKGTQPPSFGPCLLWPNGRPS